MSRLAASATARIRALLADLAAYTAQLRERPSELPQFAAYMEVAWGHLLEDGAKRRAVAYAQVWGWVGGGVPSLPLSETRNPFPHMFTLFHTGPHQSAYAPPIQEHIGKLYDVLVAAIVKPTDAARTASTRTATTAGAQGVAGSSSSDASAAPIASTTVVLAGSTSAATIAAAAVSLMLQGGSSGVGGGGSGNVLLSPSPSHGNLASQDEQQPGGGRASTACTACTSERARRGRCTGFGGRPSPRCPGMNKLVDIMKCGRFRRTLNSTHAHCSHFEGTSRRLMPLPYFTAPRQR